MIVTRYGKVIGEYNEKENVFTKKVKLSRHLMLTLDAWGMDLDTFNRCLRKNCLIRVIDDKGNIYEIVAQAMKEKGIEKDYGHGKQIFLERSKWVLNGKKQLQIT